MAEPLQLIPPSGTPDQATLVSPNDAGILIKAGWRQATPADLTEAAAIKESGSPLGMARTAVEQGLGGATVGISPNVTNALGITTPEQQARDVKANPTVSGVSNIIGSVAPIVATGGLLAPEAAEGKLAGTVGSRILAAGGREAAIGAGQGALLGAGNWAGQQALDPKLTAETLLSADNMKSLLAQTAFGTVTGGVLGGGAGMLTRAAGEGAHALSPWLKGMQEDLVREKLNLPLTEGAAPTEGLGYNTTSEAQDLAEQSIARNNKIDMAAGAPDRSGFAGPVGPDIVDDLAKKGIAHATSTPEQIINDSRNLQKQADSNILDILGDQMVPIQQFRDAAEEAGNPIPDAVIRHAMGTGGPSVPRGPPGFGGGSAIPTLEGYEMPLKNLWAYVSTENELKPGIIDEMKNALSEKEGNAFAKNVSDFALGKRGEKFGQLSAETTRIKASPALKAVSEDPALVKSAVDNLKALRNEANESGVVTGEFDKHFVVNNKVNKELVKSFISNEGLIQNVNAMKALRGMAAGVGLANPTSDAVKFGSEFIPSLQAQAFRADSTNAIKSILEKAAPKVKGNEGEMFDTLAAWHVLTGSHPITSAMALIGRRVAANYNREIAGTILIKLNRLLNHMDVAPRIASGAADRFSAETGFQDRNLVSSLLDSAAASRIPADEAAKGAARQGEEEKPASATATPVTPVSASTAPPEASTPPTSYDGVGVNPDTVRADLTRQTKGIYSPQETDMLTEFFKTQVDQQRASAISGVSERDANIQMEEAIKAIQDHMESLSKDVVDKGLSAKPMDKIDPEELIKDGKQINRMVNNPEVLLDKATALNSDVAGHAPDVAQASAGTMNTAINYLESVVPQESRPYPLSPPTPPSRAALLDFQQRLEAVQDPLGAIARTAAGEATMQTVRAVYPALLKELQASVMTELSQSQNMNLSSTQKKQISNILGLPMDGSTDPAYIALMQSAFLGTKSPTNQGLGAKPHSRSPKSPVAGKMPALAPQFPLQGS